NALDRALDAPAPGGTPAMPMQHSGMDHRAMDQGTMEHGGMDHRAMDHGATHHDGALYTCSMHPDVRQPAPGSCPKCGMKLVPMGGEAPTTSTEYVCPMHPQIVRNAPGSCPICGMALEPRTVTADEENAELKDMTRRFWARVAFSVPLLVFVMGDMLPGQPLRHVLSGRLIAWLQLVLATPVVLWGGWPFFVRGW